MRGEGSPTELVIPFRRGASHLLLPIRHDHAFASWLVPARRIVGYEPAPLTTRCLLIGLPIMHSVSGCSRRPYNVTKLTSDPAAPTLGVGVHILVATHRQASVHVADPPTTSMAARLQCTWSPRLVKALTIRSRGGPETLCQPNVMAPSRALSLSTPPDPEA